MDLIFEDGYRVFEDVLLERECTALIETLGLDNGNADRAGLRNLMAVSEVERVARDTRLSAICRRITGRDLIPYKATLFNKTGKANWLVAWHQDTALPIEFVPESEHWGPTSKKSGVTYVHAPTSVLRTILALRIHLDPSTESNGPLRVIPGSHRERILEDGHLRKIIDQGPAVPVLVGRGGIIAMSPLTLHASSKCVRSTPRRVLHIEYAESLEIGPGIKLAIA